MSRIGNYKSAIELKELMYAGIYVLDPSKSPEEKIADFDAYLKRAMIAGTQFELNPEESQRAIEILKK